MHLLMTLVYAKPFYHLHLKHETTYKNYQHKNFNNYGCTVKLKINLVVTTKFWFPSLKYYIRVLHFIGKDIISY